MTYSRSQSELMIDKNAPFRHYTAKHRIIAWISQNLFDWPVYTVHTGLLSGLRRKGGLGFLPSFITKTAHTKEDDCWQELADAGEFRGRTVFDVGGFHAKLTIFFVRHGARVVAYEPTARNRKRFVENVALNGFQDRVTLRPLALGDYAGEGEITLAPLMPGGASLDGKMARSISRAELTHAARERVTVTTLDEDISANALPAPNFIKLDVEGFELMVLKGATNTLGVHRPSLFVEMHGETMNEKEGKAAELVEFLAAARYEVTHVESGATITVANSADAAEGHLLCRPIITQM